MLVIQGICALLVIQGICTLLVIQGIKSNEFNSSVHRCSVQDVYKILRVGVNDEEKDELDDGAWPLLVGGAICLVNSDNERDPNLLTSPRV